jgi:hypothetical protein
MDIYIQKIADEAATIKGFYKSAIFIGASRPAETSGDVSTGGVGTQALLKAVNKAKNGDGQATIKQILDDMVQDAYGQTPTYCVYPKSLADDFFFDPPAGYLPTNPINAVMAPEDKICKN